MADTEQDHRESMAYRLGTMLAQAGAALDALNRPGRKVHDAKAILTAAIAEEERISTQIIERINAARAEREARRIARG